MKVLVTGSHGFVGRHFVKRLVDDGHDVLGIDNMSSGIPQRDWLFQPLLPREYFCIDLRDWMKTADAGYFDLIIHLAAVVGGRLKIDYDPLAVATDLSIDAEFFHWCVRGKVKPRKVVYFSSSAAYPINLQRKGQHTPLSESYIDFKATRIGMPDQTYGFAKFAGEYLAQYAVKNYGLDVVCYRPFGGYGEDQDFNYPFPSIMKRVLDREDPVIVWGSGDQQRDFIHISDCVDCVLETMSRLAPGEALNIGTGIPTSFADLAKLAGGVLGRHINVKNDASKPEGVFSRVSAPFKMEQWFVPKVSLREGVKRVLKHLDSTRVASVV